MGHHECIQAETDKFSRGWYDFLRLLNVGRFAIGSRCRQEAFYELTRAIHASADLHVHGEVLRGEWRTQCRRQSDYITGMKIHLGFDQFHTEIESYRRRVRA